MSAVSRWAAAAHLGPLRGGGLWGSVVVVLAYLAISIPQYAQPYVIDEAVFPYVADGILKNGLPVFYNGESRPQDIGLWHPPLYDYLLAAQVGTWGMSPFAVRSFGAICVIAAFFILTLALRRIAPAIPQYAYVAMGALFLLNPLVIGDALVPDIDGTLGVLIVAVALWLSTVIVQNPVSRRWVLAVFGFALLVVSTKFILAGIVAAIIGCAALIVSSRRWWKVLWVVVAFAAGTAVSLALLFGLGALFGFDGRAPFTYLFGSLGSRPPGSSGLEGTIVHLMGGPGSNLVWIGPAIIACAIAVLIVLLVAKPRGVSRSLAALVVVSSLVITVGYSYITASPFNFPKYTALVVPGLALGVALVLGLLPGILPATVRRSPATTRVLVALYVLVLLIGAIGTFALATRFEATHVRASSELLYLAVADFVGVTVVTAVFVWLLSTADPGRGLGRARRPLTIGLVAALVLSPVLVQTSSSLVNATSPFSTRYYYRERGMAEFLAQAGDIIPAGATVIAPKDVGLQLDRPFWEDAGLLPLKPSQLREQVEKIDAPYLVTRSLYDYSEEVYPDQFDVLRESYEPLLESDEFDFTLWKMK